LKEDVLGVVESIDVEMDPFERPTEPSAAP